MQPTRRRFLVRGVQLAALAPLAGRVPSLAARGTARSGSAADRVLVVIQLTGGNDGLNTVVPHRQDGYYRARPTLALARSSLAPLDDDHGLHPALAPLRPLYDAGQLAVVQGAGPPAPDRSHFHSLRVWHTADPEDPSGDVGWLGRLADQLAARHPADLCALHVGSGDLPLSLWSRGFRVPTVRDPRGFRLRELAPAVERARDELLARGGGSADLAFLRDAARSAYATAARMEVLAERSSPVDYPSTTLARELALVARLVRGGFGTRIFHLELGGFDTHARQAPVHAALLGELSGALAAFLADLTADGLDRRVACLAFSEFGRRVRENGSRGTDHGAGAPLLVAGGSVRGGLRGTAPDLERLVEGDVPATTDFRSVYAALETEWLRLAPSTGAPPLDLLA